MSAHSGDEERGRQPGPDGVDSVPAPWGEVIIPDDISELADDAAEIRRELQREHRSRRWARRLGVREDAASGPGILGPICVVLLTMSLALVSLFGGFWPNVSAEPDSGQARGPSGSRLIPDVTLTDANGADVRLRDAGPAIILHVGACECTDLIAESAAVAGRAEAPLLVVGQPAAPDLAPILKRTGTVRALDDPRGALARRLFPSRAPARGTAIAVLLARDGSMRQVMTDVRSAEEFASGAAHLR